MRVSVSFNKPQDKDHSAVQVVLQSALKLENTINVHWNLFLDL